MTEREVLKSAAASVYCYVISKTWNANSKEILILLTSTTLPWKRNRLLLGKMTIGYRIPNNN
jgi:hypothetical protein